MSINTKTANPPTTEPGLPAEATAPKVHLGYLDSLRALAAINVVMVHAMDQVDRNGLHSVGFAHWFRTHCGFGHQAVGLFIVLSGFCLMLPVAKGDGILRGGAWNFFKKRARRILPTYYLSLAVCLLLIGTILNQKTGSPWDLTFPVTKLDLVAHLLLIQDAISGAGAVAGKINYALWTVSVEWRIYFVFPLLVLAWRKIGALRTTALAVAAGYVLLVLLRPTPLQTQIDGISPEYLGLFAMGMLGAGITFSGDEKLAHLRQRVPWIWVALATTFLLLALSHVRFFHDKVSILDFFVGLWAMSLLVAAGHRNDTRLHRVLSWKPLAFVGTFAYSIYVIHAPLLQLIWLYVVRPLRLTTNMEVVSVFSVFIPLVVAGAYVFFLACERPFLNRPVALNTK